MSLDLSIPDGLPDDVVAKLRDLQQELDVSIIYSMVGLAFGILTVV